MTHVRMTLVKMVATTGLGAAIMSGSACATTAQPVSAMSPADAALVADQDCVGVPQKEREQGILAYRDAIAGTSTLKEAQQVGKVKFEHDRGVVIALRAQQGMSVPWLNRVASCHMALAAAGRGASVGNDDPLLVKGASVTVEEAGTGFIVSIRVPNDEANSDVARRSYALMTGVAGPATAQADKR